MGLILVIYLVCVVIAVDAFAFILILNVITDTLKRIAAALEAKK